jgi:hypothetical protein
MTDRGDPGYDVMERREFVFAEQQAVCCGAGRPLTMLTLLL